MMKKQLLRSVMASFALLAGMAQTHAEQVTLAAWDFANDVKYTASATDGGKTYYTASANTKENMEYSFLPKLLI